MDLLEIPSGDSYRHPWELSRAQSVLKIINNENVSRFADIGAGDQFFAREISLLTGKQLYACDINYDEKNWPDHKNIITVTTIEDIPENSIEMVFLLDVLEHVEDERVFLSDVKKIMVENGKMIITVPAFQFLFGEHDRRLRHYRRYSKENLSSVLLESDLIADRVFYVYTSLFFLRAMGKLFRNKAIQKSEKHTVGSWRYSKTHPATLLVTALLNCDFSVNSLLDKTFNKSLPGLSICAIARKVV